MKLKSYEAISLTDIRSAFIAFGGTREQFDSFERTVLRCAYARVSGRFYREPGRGG